MCRDFEEVEKFSIRKCKMTSTFMSMPHHGGMHCISTAATTMSSYGISYFNDACSSGECSDGYQSSVSPVASPALGHYNYGSESFACASSFSPKKTCNYQGDGSYYPQSSANFSPASSSFRNAAHHADYSHNSYKLNVQIKPFAKTSNSHFDIKPQAPTKLAKVNRFVQQFSQQHESLSKKLLDAKDLEAEDLPPPPPEVMKKRRVAANARERRRMNNLNFAFDR